MNSLKYLKTIQIHIDPAIISDHYGSQISSHLDTLGVAVKIEPQMIPQVVTWTRVDSKKIEDAQQSEDIKHVLYIIQAQELVDAIGDKILIAKFQSITNIYGGSNITILVCGLREYCRKQQKSIDRYSLEADLLNLQIELNISYRLIEAAAELAITIGQFTKSVAEMPHRLIEAKTLENQNFYVCNDNKDCVDVKGTIGLARLWQQHLIKFPLVTLETAEAIVSNYPMVRVLLNAYKMTDDGSNLLANIPVRRTGGPLSSVRKIGPELSKKIFLLYTNTDPNFVL